MIADLESPMQMLDPTELARRQGLLAGALHGDTLSALMLRRQFKLTFWYRAKVGVVIGHLRTGGH